MEWLKKWFGGWKLITSTRKYPSTDLYSCFANLKKRGFQPRHVLDIGANRGRWSADCRRAFPDAQFTLIEPQAEMSKPLDRFCSQMGEANWMQLGVSDKPGTLPFVVYEDQVSSTFDFDPSKKMRGCEIREIPVTTINEMIRRGQCPIPDILKIDAEGFESKILQAADLALGKCELVFLEAQMFNDESDCSMVHLSNQMDRLGYAPYDFSWFGQRVQDGAIALCEIVFARKNGFLRSNQEVRFDSDYSKVKQRVA